MRNHKNIIAWMKFKKLFYGLTEDIMIGSVYISRRFHLHRPESVCFTPERTL